jgi:hypothetical protein
MGRIAHFNLAEKLLGLRFVIPLKIPVVEEGGFDDSTADFVDRDATKGQFTRHHAVSSAICAGK